MVGMSEIITAIGLMSGTSLDGIDAAIIKTDGYVQVEVGESTSLDYDDKLQSRIKEVIAGQGDCMAVERDITLLHAQAVEKLLEKANLKPEDIDVIGFHGQTIDHRPEQGITLQIGNGSLLAEKTGISVVYDFRRRDVAAGGQGAPFVPIYHAALFGKRDLPIAIVNIGGVSNVTYVGKGEDEVIGFDTGTGNALINDIVYAETKKSYDEDGNIAASGNIQQNIVDKMLQHDYFSRGYPKSLDRNSFNTDLVTDLKFADSVATLAAFTVQAIAKSQEVLPAAPKEWIITGGGRHNKYMMKMLEESLSGKVTNIDEYGYDGDMLEAEAFAYLAVRHIKRLPITFPTTTGVTRQKVVCGVFCPS